MLTSKTCKKMFSNFKAILICCGLNVLYVFTFEIGGVQDRQLPHPTCTLCEVFKGSSKVQRPGGNAPPGIGYQRGKRSLLESFSNYHYREQPNNGPLSAQEVGVSKEIVTDQEVIYKDRFGNIVSKRSKHHRGAFASKKNRKTRSLEPYSYYLLQGPQPGDDDDYEYDDYEDLYTDGLVIYKDRYRGDGRKNMRRRRRKRIKRSIGLNPYYGNYVASPPDWVWDKASSFGEYEGHNLAYQSNFNNTVPMIFGRRRYPRFEEDIELAPESYRKRLYIRPSRFRPRVEQRMPLNRVDAKERELAIDMEEVDVPSYNEIKYDYDASGEVDYRTRERATKQARRRRHRSRSRPKREAFEPRLPGFLSRRPPWLKNDQEVDLTPERYGDRFYFPSAKRRERPYEKIVQEMARKEFKKRRQHKISVMVNAGAMSREHAKIDVEEEMPPLNNRKKRGVTHENGDDVLEKALLHVDKDSYSLVYDPSLYHASAIAPKNRPKQRAMNPLVRRGIVEKKDQFKWLLN